MICPECRNSMLVLEIEGVEIDHCLECGGVWLDSGELELLVGDGDREDALLKSIRETNVTGERILKCPICRKKMAKVSIDSDKIILDSCRKNHGIWLNKGELESVLTSAGYDQSSPVMRLLKDIFDN